MMRLRAGVASHRGLVRHNNEDSYLVRWGFYVVCDGMGGARAGEVASEMACSSLSTLDPEVTKAEGLREAILEADRAIAERSTEEEGLLGMGTTLTAALAGEGGVTLAHVGDSRAYLLHDGELAQLTQDHSWVGEMVRRGELTPAQAAVHPHRSVITRVLGTGGDFEPDIISVPVEDGDRLLLCSDGLTGMVSDPDLVEILRKEEDPQATAQALIEAALAGGGEDNVTVVVVDILPGAPEDEASGGSERSEALEEDDKVLLGPPDRGVGSTGPGPGGRPQRGVRRRLGARVGSLRGPSLRRPVSGAPAGDRDGVIDEAGAERPAASGSPTASASGTAGSADGAGAPTVAPAPIASPTDRWTRRRVIIVTIAVVLVFAILIGAFAGYNSTVYYVGTQNGMVALFHGLPASILGISLSSVVEVGTVARDSLAPYLQARVDAHDLLSKEEGRLFLQTLGAQ